MAQIVEKQNENAGNALSVLESQMAMLMAAYLVIATLYATKMTANISASSLAVVLSVLGGTFVAVEQMPKVLRIFSIASPNRWMLEFL